MAPILVLGIGNLLMGDDGIGVRVIRELEGRDLPPEVELVDGGTGGPTLMVYFAGTRALVIVDAVNLGAAPGTVRTFSLDEIEHPDGPAPFSLHDVGLDAMLQLARELDELPPVVRIVGIQPERFDQGDHLSPAVEAAVVPAADAVFTEIENLL